MYILFLLNFYNIPYNFYLKNPHDNLSILFYFLKLINNIQDDKINNYL